MSQILQIVPALPGWFVAYEFENGKICKLPVACWALCETNDGYETRFIRPITVDGQGGSMAEADNDSPGCIAMGKYVGIVSPCESLPCEIVENNLTPNASMSGPQRPARKDEDGTE